jgi:hypothetical protein
VNVPAVVASKSRPSGYLLRWCRANAREGELLLSSSNDRVCATAAGTAH